ncbi:hypothetical protein R1sor_026407 [Riccia sorocarpa]|uniref:MULE transposase domain-containing protein n=1 Tax=Riccia sorocarpa TaxID=122646 RepID=A0ABD3GGZ3_9MARC
MEGVNYMDGSDMEETIFTSREMTVEEWESLNDHRWYKESPVYSPVLNVGGVNNVNPSILENWQRSARNLRGEMDIGGKSLHEVTSSKGIRTVGFEFVDTDFQRERKSFNDFAARRNTPAFPRVHPDRPDLNLEEQVFSQCTQRRKKRVGVKGGCGEKDRYDATQMVRFSHADSDGDDLDKEDIEGEEQDCDDDPKKVGRKIPSQGTRCEWRVRCQYNKKSDEYKITTLNLQHTCPGHLHKWRGPTSKAPWLAQVFGDRIRSEYRRPVGQLQTEFRRQYTRDVEYMPMFRMRSRCQDIISGCQQQSFSQIPSLCARISEVDPSAVVLPLAYAIAPTENYENWKWFIQNLMASVEGLESPNLIIVSDRQKGLEKAVAEMLPRNFHMHCAHHLKMNVQKHFGTAAGKAFLTLVYMNDQTSYERRLVEMETGVSKGPDLVRYIRQIPVDRYVRFAIPLPRYARTTSNIVECINGALKPVRDYTPCHIIWQMWNYMLNLFYARRETARISSNELTEFATSRMTEIVKNCGSFVAIKTIPIILQKELPMSVACRAPPAAIRNGRQRIVRIPNGGSVRSAEYEYSYPIEDDSAMNPAVVMTNVSQEDAVERGNPLVQQSSVPQGEQLSQAPPVARNKGRRCCGACKQPGHTRRTCPTLRQYRRAKVQEGLDVAANA